MSTEIRGRLVLRPAGNVATEIGGRPVLRPAGNVALRDARAFTRKAVKPPSSPVKPTITPVGKNSPPTSQPAISKTVVPPQTRSSVSCKPPPSPRETPRIPNSATKPCLSPSSADFGCTRDFVDPLHVEGVSVAKEAASIIDSLPDLSLDHESPVHKSAPKPANVSDRKSPRQPVAQQRKFNSRIDLTRSSGDGFLKDRGNEGPKAKANFGLVGRLSLDEISLADIMAGKKAAAIERNAQKKFRIADYGRKQGKAGRVAPDLGSLPPISNEPRRCKFITAQTDPLHIAYHDQEWGVPVHDDRKLFELLILAGAQVELSWSTILKKREAYRAAFSEFDVTSVAKFKEKHIQALEADRSLLLPGGMIRGVVDNAQRILEIGEDYGSLDNYLWGFLNHKPTLNNFQYPKQVPAKTSKAEGISKDLVKRGFRFVGPTIIYSFMQAAGMTNDHLVQCFRHEACEKLSSLPQRLTERKEEQSQVLHQCEILELHLDMDENIRSQKEEKSSGEQQQQLS